jgi:hypothetical protein
LCINLIVCMCVYIYLKKSDGFFYTYFLAYYKKYDEDEFKF